MEHDKTGGQGKDKYIIRSLIAPLKHVTMEKQFCEQSWVKKGSGHKNIYLKLVCRWVGRFGKIRRWGWEVTTLQPSDLQLILSFIRLLLLFVFLQVLGCHQRPQAQSSSIFPRYSTELVTRGKNILVIICLCIMTCLMMGRWGEDSDPVGCSRSWWWGTP